MDISSNGKNGLLTVVLWQSTQRFIHSSCRPQSLYTWINYRRGCFDGLNTKPFAVNEDFGKVDVDSEDAFLVVEFAWRAGLGQYCLLVATLLKIVDIIINIVLPTPTITRDHQEQVDYEWRYGQIMENDDKPNDNEADSLRVRNATTECTSSPRMENDNEPYDDEADCPSPRARKGSFQCSSRV